jgi:hypothetical protein
MEKDKEYQTVTTMKNTSRFLTALFFMLASAGIVYAQENAEKKYDLRPEFTLRGTLGFFNSNHRVTGGVSINGKSTVGLMLGHHESYRDDIPCDIHLINTALYCRRYFHLGKQKRFAFYIDAYAGAGWVYKVNGNRYETNHETGKEEPLIETKPGDVFFIAGLQPGFRVRCYRNLHIFIGPSIGTDCIGAHIGIGL